MLFGHLQEAFDQAALSLRRCLAHHWPSDASGRNMIAEANISHHLSKALLDAGFLVFPEHPAVTRAYELSEGQRFDMLCYHGDHSCWVGVEVKRYLEAGVAKDVAKLLHLMPLLPEAEQAGWLGVVACFALEPTTSAWNRGQIALEPLPVEMTIVRGSVPVYEDGGYRLSIIYALFGTEALSVP